ncbi:MAG: hypothetical protein OS112_02770 [Methanoregula sp.]|nr:MAG: hypothetical protein OS112_02770 [Methanoregula sp.]
MITLIQEEADREAAALDTGSPDRDARTGRTGTSGPDLWGNEGIGAEGMHGGPI